MLTRCPSCATTFRITPEQLKAKQGRVRCGQCHKVFNAIETLADAPAATSVSASAETPEDGTIGVAPAPTSAELTLEPAPPRASDEPGAETVVVIPEAAPAPAAAEAAIEEEQPGLADYEPTLNDLLADPPPQRRWPWVLASIVALLGIGAQSVHHFRTEIAVLAPEAKPALQEICARLGCDLPLPRKIELIGIETSDLNPDPVNARRLQLVATLKNRAPFAQEYPHLELTLTDAADKALVRRVFTPADYRPAGKSNPIGLAANGDLAIGLTLEVADAQPVGYRLYVFYP